MAENEEKTIALFSFLKLFTGKYKKTKPRGINILLIMLKSCSKVPLKKELVIRNIIKSKNIRVGFIAIFLRSSLVTTKGKAITKIVIKILGKTLT